MADAMVRDLHGYGRRRPLAAWPGAARVAVSFVLNYEEGGERNAIQVLDFFDRHGVTLRRGDLRRLNKHRLDLFRDETSHGGSETTSSGRETSLVGRPDFKSGRGREPVFGGFDSHSLPPGPSRQRSGGGQ